MKTVKRLDSVMCGIVAEGPEDWASRQYGGTMARHLTRYAVRKYPFSDYVHRVRRTRRPNGTKQNA